MQASMASLRDNYFHSIIYKTLSEVFPIVRSLGVFIPSFCNRWGFFTASNTLDPFTTTEIELNKAIKEKVEGKLDFYDFGSHKYGFSLYKPLKIALKKQKLMLTDDDTSALEGVYRL